MRGLLLFLLALVAALVPAQTVTVGSKAFTEGYVMGEIARKQLQSSGFAVEHKQGIGSTGIVWAALGSGKIDFYCEYTGTIAEEILKRPGLKLDGIRAALDARGIGVAEPLGFKDNYGLTMPRKLSERLGIKTISDLARHPEIRYGISPELYKRSDGWPGLKAKYGLTGDVRTIQHALAYRALSVGDIDVTDCYTTDAEIKTFDTVVLEGRPGLLPAVRGGVPVPQGRARPGRSPASRNSRGRWTTGS